MFSPAPEQLEVRIVAVEVLVAAEEAEMVQVQVKALAQKRRMDCSCQKQSAAGRAVVAAAAVAFVAGKPFALHIVAAGVAYIAPGLVVVRKLAVAASVERTTVLVAASRYIQDA